MANLAKEAEKNGLKLPEQLCHYTQADDRNRVIYHNRSEETAGKIATVLRDAAKRKELCGTDYDESNNYCLLIQNCIRKCQTPGGTTALPQYRRIQETVAVPEWSGNNPIHAAQEVSSRQDAGAWIDTWTVLVRL